MVIMGPNYALKSGLFYLCMASELHILILIAQLEIDMALSVSAIEKLDASWMKNATRLWNIPLHPSGEMDVYDILEDISKRTDILQDQLKGIWMQLVIHLIIGYMQLRNTNIAFKMVIAQPRSLVRWCCLIPSLLGIALPIYTATFYFAKRISVVSYSAGIILVIPQTAIPAILIASTTSILSIENGVYCSIRRIWLGIFSYTAYRQYPLYFVSNWLEIYQQPFLFLTA
ncbi:hypothetical protein BDF19DRAFT_415173 [Syncephalis fuscata]|nr:hypothetical protein BDF19DRAFT_415173 [Syncephalis fuscata]